MHKPPSIFLYHHASIVAPSVLDIAATGRASTCDGADLDVG
jgi:hypothetical protein